MPASRLVAERRPEDAREQQQGDAAVTAVVCTYNGERFLEQQLLSILSQSHPVAEVIISDDASPDGTVELARRVLEASDRAYRIYTRDEPLRVSGNFEFALREARTDFLATSDQDDVWHPKKVEHLLAALVNGLRVVREPLIDYRQHSSNQIGQTAPTLQVKFAQATKDGSADQLRRYRRAVALLKRVSELGGTPEQEAHVRRKVAHERQRLQLPASRIRRLPRILKWTLRGRYATYSRGSYDIARDLFQSLKERDSD